MTTCVTWGKYLPSGSLIQLSRLQSAINIRTLGMVVSSKGVLQQGLEHTK